MTIENHPPGVFADWSTVFHLHTNIFMMKYFTNFQTKTTSIQKCPTNSSHDEIP